MVGKTVSHYKIEEKLGEGGMGVVYKARDTRLDRFVALKVLPAEKVADPERKRRFVQEAKSASALNHPNIITIHDIDQADGVDFIAMEFVEGKTLDRLIPRNGMRLGDILKYSIQIAAALARAHAAGIVHRDIKPANIMVTPDGHVKVLDFGLAKLTEPVEGFTQGSTATANTADDTGTGQGTIIGTVAYMSPEQAEGNKVDARSDIFSFGSVLYEMATGRVPFQDQTKISTLAAILHKEPSAIREIASDAPRDLEKIIARCLRKDLSRRFQHMDDVKVALEELKEDSESGKLEVGSLGQAPPAGLSISRRLAVAAFSMIVVGAGAAWWLNRPKATAPGTVPPLVRLTSDYGLTTDPALSPDGKLLAFASDRSSEGNLDIWVRQVSGGESIRLTTDPADDREPVFSPDGTKIAFRSEREGGGIYIISALGGEARRVVRQGHRPRFSPDGSQIAYTVGEPQLSAAGKSFIVPSEGGQPRQIQPDFFSVLGPIWSPDGRHILFMGTQDVRQPGFDWWVASLDGGPPIRTGAAGIFRDHRLSSVGVPASLTGALLPGLWMADTNGIVVGARSGDAVNLWQLDISPKTWQSTGAPLQLTFGAGIEVQPSAATGRIAFSVLSESTNVWSLPIDANTGRVLGEIRRLTESADRDIAPSVSADGDKVAYSRGNSLLLKDLQRGKETLLATTIAAAASQIDSDGAKVVFAKFENQKGGLYVVPTNGGEAERACQDCGTPNGWSHDGRKILCELLAARAIALVDSASGEKTEILKHPKYGLSRGRLSPDDHWISFHSITPSARRIFVAPFHGAAGIPEKEWIPITDGQAMDRYASWSPDGNLLYFLSERDGFRCIWAQRLDPATKHPSGAAFPILHFHTSRRSLMTIGDPVLMGMSVAIDKLVFSMTEQTGNIWMKNLP
jgi:eukaryotic-like serine/threonine-protein kinase